MKETMQGNGEIDQPGKQDLNPWEKMAQEVMAGELNHGAVEKKFYDTEVEFTEGGFEGFRNELLNATPDEARGIVNSRISLLEEKADKVELLSPSHLDQHKHRGYISGDTIVRFDNSRVGSQYKLKNTEYLYDAVDYLRNNKEQINNARQFFEKVTGFLNSYFGIPDTSKDRLAVIERKTNFESIEDDNEYWNAIENIDISVFKGEHIAQCSERSAMAQNILSLFGYETYYTFGSVSVDGTNEAHAYNIVTNAKGQKTLMDYSVTSVVEHNGTSWDMPTMAKINDYESFAAGGHLKTHTMRHIIQNDGTVTHQQEHTLEYDMMK